MSWGGGGNLPPLLAAARLLAARGHSISVLASAATRDAALEAGFDVVAYRRAPDPNMALAFEQQAAKLMATAAGSDLALDVCDAVEKGRPDLMIVDCMVPAGIAVGEAMRTPTTSLVHFPYGLARAQMLSGAGAWTTDRTELDTTRRRLGLRPTADDLTAWESADLLLVTVPAWFDLVADYPPNVVHAGPLGVMRGTQVNPTRRRPLVLLSFSTTVMQGQTRLVQRVCDALAGEDMDAILTVGPAVIATDIHVPTNVQALPYADHDELLPACGAVVTHGGLGTTLRALGHGKPLLLLPLGRDQEFNARRVAELGAGIRLSLEAARHEISSALMELVSRPHFTEAAERTARMIAADAPDEAAVAALMALFRRRAR